MSSPTQRARRNRRPRSFRCLNCHLDVPADAPGTAHRNHCPTCLWSRHVDHIPGDRAAGCGARMEPIAITARRDGEWLLIHRCVQCDELHRNRIAGDDNAVILFELAVRPLARSPFPLAQLVRL
ncbi:RNHCP domain-containing protein [Phytoactinopolyspora mesophila]|uniref:RNHCP domain-containing protein n=1 Tax=Phytoactinopolyspora mesophila TaxID=2650750 RepID=A0A7K3MA35_9ACTN|nr:RNHCP domain-containing protein [Phytoactinopolyspora mesophila]NDL60060.1 RNHCP domain-containing protein [Phytoactinopolyspora mesophila]